MTQSDKLFTPLSEDEQALLDAFLLDRVPEPEDETDDRDEGVLGLSELDGFFTAIVSGPEELQPSDWLPALWGECEPVWESEDQLTEVFVLLMRHMNGVAAHLMEEPETFEPMFMTNTVEDKDYLVVDDWCTGYVRGMALKAEAWREGGSYMEMLLQPIFAFGTEAGWDELKTLEPGEEEELQQRITPAVRAIHAHWLDQRANEVLPAVGIPFQRTAPRVGRNDPCPCGSGRKYKHCCLH